MLRPDEVITVKEDNMERHRNPKYCFSWSNFKGHMMDQMGELLRDEKFVDVTIFCENRSFKAHKIILCGASPFFKSLLEDNQSPCPDISMGFTPWTHMTWILQFIYSGQVSIPEDSFPEFLETAKLLQISTLCKKTCGKKYGRSSKAEVPAKKARLVEPSEPLASPPPAPQPPQQQQQPVFFRTQAIMAELQQATAAVSQDAVHLVPTDHIEVQAEEVVEIECTTEHMGNFNPHDSYCIPGGPPAEPLSPPQQDNTSPSKQYKHTIVFEPYHTSTIKSTHSLAPKTCNMCGKVYSNLSNLRQHVNLVHTASKSVQCPLCGKFFKSDLYMRRHLICAHSVTPVRKEQITWRETKAEVQNTSSATSETPSVQQQMWSEMNAAVASLTQNIHSNNG